MSGVLNNRAVANQQQNITSINSLIGNNDVSYENLMKNVKGVGHFNMGEIVFEKGKKTGSFSRVNNHAGCLSIFNNVVTTAEQNRATNAAVFKALLQKYDNPGADSTNLLTQDFGEVYNNGKLDDAALKDLFGGKTNPYLLEAFKFLVLEKDSAPLSRDELRLLDTLLARGKKNPNEVKANMKLLGDLKAMKSGAAPIDLRKVTDSTKAEYWISGLHVKNLSPDEFKRLTTETVNKRAAREESEYTHVKGNDRKDAYARLVLFDGMPELVNTVNENIRYTLARSLKVDGEKTVDRFLTLLTSGIEGGFESGWAAFVKKNKGLEARLEGKMMTLADLKKSVYNQLIDYLGECLHRHNPKLTPQIFSSSKDNAFRNMYNGIRAKTTEENYLGQLSVKGRLLDRLVTHDYVHDPRFDFNVNNGERPEGHQNLVNDSDGAGKDKTVEIKTEEKINTSPKKGKTVEIKAGGKGKPVEVFPPKNDPLGLSNKADLKKPLQQKGGRLCWFFSLINGIRTLDLGAKHLQKLISPDGQKVSFYNNDNTMEEYSLVKDTEVFRRYLKTFADKNGYEIPNLENLTPLEICALYHAQTLSENWKPGRFGEMDVACKMLGLVNVSHTDDEWKKLNSGTAKDFAEVIKAHLDKHEVVTFNKDDSHFYTIVGIEVDEQRGWILTMRDSSSNADKEMDLSTLLSEWDSHLDSLKQHDPKLKDDVLRQRKASSLYFAQVPAAYEQQISDAKKLIAEITDENLHDAMDAKKKFYHEDFENRRNTETKNDYEKKILLESMLDDLLRADLIARQRKDETFNVADIKTQFVDGGGKNEMIRDWILNGVDVTDKAELCKKIAEHAIKVYYDDAEKPDDFKFYSSDGIDKNDRTLITDTIGDKDEVARLLGISNKDKIGVEDELERLLDKSNEGEKQQRNLGGHEGVNENKIVNTEEEEINTSVKPDVKTEKANEGKATDRSEINANVINEEKTDEDELG